MNEHDCRRVKGSILHKCVMHISMSCITQNTARFGVVFHTMCRAQRYVFFTLQNIHYKTRNDHVAHDVIQNTRPKRAFSHLFHVNNNLPDTYIPIAALRSVLGRTLSFCRSLQVCASRINAAQGAS